MSAKHARFAKARQFLDNPCQVRRRGHRSRPPCGILLLLPGAAGATGRGAAPVVAGGGIVADRVAGLSQLAVATRVAHRGP